MTSPYHRQFFLWIYWWLWVTFLLSLVLTGFIGEKSRVSSKYALISGCLSSQFLVGNKNNMHSLYHTQRMHLKATLGCGDSGCESSSRSLPYGRKYCTLRMVGQMLSAFNVSKTIALKLNDMKWEMTYKSKWVMQCTKVINIQHQRPATRFITTPAMYTTTP